MISVWGKPLPPSLKLLTHHPDLAFRRTPAPARSLLWAVTACREGADCTLLLAGQGLWGRLGAGVGQPWGRGGGGVGLGVMSSALGLCTRLCVTALA